MIRLLLVPVGVLVIAIPSAAPGQQEPSTPPDSITVIVRNVRIDAVTVSARHEGAYKRRLGRVDGHGERTFVIVWRRGEFRMTAKADGEREFVSNEVVTRPGDRLEFVVHPSFQMRSLRLVGTDRDRPDSHAPSNMQLVLAGRNVLEEFVFVRQVRSAVRAGTRLTRQ